MGIDYRIVWLIKEDFLPSMIVEVKIALKDTD